VQLTVIGEWRKWGMTHFPAQRFLGHGTASSLNQRGAARRAEKCGSQPAMLRKKKTIRFRSFFDDPLCFSSITFVLPWFFSSHQTNRFFKPNGASF
jgi:hypothetical protein